MVKVSPRTKLEQLQNRVVILEEKLKQKRLLLGSADGAMISALPSGRFELEDEIQILQINLAQVKEEIKKLQR